MLYQKIDVLGTRFYVVRNDVGIVYFGQPNGQTTEILDRFPNCLFEKNDKLIYQVEKQLNDYFLKATRCLNFPIATIGTSFENQVWQHLQTIEYGQTTTYLEVAKSLGDGKKARAVANAIAKNPLFIIIPCHRVIGSDGQLHGYRWGQGMKQTLLNLERGSNNVPNN